MIARVEPLTTTRRLAGPFDYALPAAPVEVGSIVRVPFGRQALDGVVVGLAETHRGAAPDKLVTPTAVREDSVPPELVELALWMARRVLLHARHGRCRWCCRRKGKPRDGAVGGERGRRARRTSG